MVKTLSGMIAMNAKHLRFVEKYLIDQNATRAAVAAGYSEKTARVQGSRLLTNVNVFREIQACRQQISSEMKTYSFVLVMFYL